MEISWSPVFKKIALLITGALVWRVIAGTENITVQVVAFTAACVVPILLMKIDVLHPWCWYSAFFCLYSIAYPLLYQMGETRFGFDSVNLQYHLVALYSALLVIPAKSHPYEARRGSRGFVVRTGVLNRIMYVLTVLLLLGGVLYISRRGFSSKGDIYRQTGLVMSVIFRIPMVLCVLVPMVVVDAYNKRKKVSFGGIMLGFVACAALGMLSGERDLLLRFLIILFLLLVFLGVVKRRHFLPIGAALVATLPLSAIYKYYFLARRVSTVKVEKGFLYSFLTSDFHASGQNLQNLIEHTGTEGLFGFRRLLQDLSSLFTSEISLTSWYNKTYFAGEKSGKGFTLVGEGYLISGLAGIVAVFLLAGLLIRVFYRISAKNMYCFSAYLYFIPLMVYAIRGDMATIFSGIINQILPIELVIFMLVTLSRRRAERNHELQPSRAPA